MDSWYDAIDVGRVAGGVTRRRLIGRLAAGVAAPAVASILATEGVAQNATPAATPAATPDPIDVLRGLGKDPRMIVYGTTTFGIPLGLVDGLTVPNDLVFIRSHGPTSLGLAPDSYRLTVSGLVERALSLSLADLQGMPRRTITAFLECSGDSRSRFQPKAKGAPWGNTAIGNAEWVGVPLAAVLDRAGVKEGAVDVVSQGSDFAEMQRGLPLDKARDPNTLLVWQMNGQPLPDTHGGPVRLFVPGWGGIASTKWLARLEVIDRPFAGRFNTESYVVIDENKHVIRAVTTMPVKSIITAPDAGATLPPGPQRVAGYAWSGNGGIAKVEVSTDGGGTWSDAPITLRAGRLSWVRFEHPWNAAPGAARLRTRAYDERGLTQPDAVPWNAKGYHMNAVDEVALTVG